MTSQSLQIVIKGLVDYAGLFPPASLDLAAAAENYVRYLYSADSWILGKFVVPEDKLGKLAGIRGLSFSVLAEKQSGRWPPEVRSMETRIIGKTTLPTYVEIPVDQADALSELKKLRLCAKVRTGGVTPDRIPSSAGLASFLCACARQLVAFKATAGLHHPLRSEHPLSSEKDAPRAVMHGFINVFVAAAFAWQGWREEKIAAVLEETDPEAFRFSDVVCWRDSCLTSLKLADARGDFAHSFGSCSFEEPVAGLRQLGWLT